jgi:transposase
MDRAKGIDFSRPVTEAGMQKAKVALARKLAVIMHRMLADGTAFHSIAASKQIAAVA